LFDQALELDPDYALAYSGLADAHALLAGPYGGEPPRKGMEAALRAVHAALVRAPDLAEAHCSLGCVHCFYAWDFDQAADAFRKSLSLAEGYATAHQWFAMNLLMLERFEEASAALDRARALDPRSAATAACSGLIAYCQGQNELAIEHYDRILAEEPEFALAHFFRGEALVEMGSFDEATEALSQARLLTNGTVEVLSSLAAAYSRASDTERCNEICGILEARKGYVSSYRRAQVALARGQQRVALDHLRQALKERCADMVWLRARPTFHSLRGDHDFEQICRQVFEQPSQVLTLADPSIRLPIL